MTSTVQTYEVIAEFEMEGSERPSTPPLFDQTRLRKPEYWQCIKLIAPEEGASRVWRASEALGAWCIPCHKRVRWRLGKSTGVHRHMELYHGDLLEGRRRRRHLKKGFLLPATPPLFNQIRLRRPEYWQCIKLIAPSEERRAWKASEALGSWCTLCEEEVTWTLGNIQGVKRHMQAHHPQLLLKRKDAVEDRLGECNEEEEDEENEGLPSQKTGDILLHSLNEDNHQKLGEAVLLKWIAETLQPLNIVEATSFQDLVQFLSNFKGEFTLPSRSRVNKSLEALWERLRIKMCESIRQELRSYCLVFKSWKPRSKSDSLVLELELRYVSSSDFTLKSLTLEMERTAGGLTGESIQAWLEDALQKWDLPLATLSILTGDSRASLEEACKAMGIRHVPCVQLGLARIANALLLLSTGEDDEENEAEEKEDSPLIILEVRELLRDVRSIAAYLESSKAARDRVCPGGEELPLETKRWTSAYDMISKFIKLKGPIQGFLEYLKTPRGLAEFEWRDLPSLNESRWALLEGLSILLGCLYQSKSLLEQDRNPSVLYALSILRRVREILKDPGTFYGSSSPYRGPLSRRLEEFKAAYGHEEFFDSMSRRLDVIRSTLSDLFERAFRGLESDEDTLWISVLDPRLRRMKYLSESEQRLTRSRLVKEVLELRKDLPPPIIPKADEEEEEGMSDLFNPCDIFDSVWEEEEIQEGSRDYAGVEREVDNYLSDESLVSFRKDPLIWWREHRYQFPQISLLAMKWLSASANSIEDEEVLQTRHWASKAQFMIMRNSSSLNLTIEDTMKGLG